MEKISLCTYPRVMAIKFNKETSIDYLYEDKFTFVSGCNGVISEFGLGANGISYLLSGEKVIKEEKIIYNDKKLDVNQLSIGWYVGNYKSLNFIDRYTNIGSLLKRYIKKENVYSCIDEVLDEFGINKNLLESNIYNCGWVYWRVFIALGVCLNKKVFCFPYLNTARVSELMTCASVYRCIDILKEREKIIIIPTSSAKNLIPIIDNEIILKNPEVNTQMLDNLTIREYYKDKFTN